MLVNVSTEAFYLIESVTNQRKRHALIKILFELLAVFSETGNLPVSFFFSSFACEGLSHLFFLSSLFPTLISLMSGRGLTYSLAI